MAFDSGTTRTTYIFDNLFIYAAILITPTYQDQTCILPVLRTTIESSTRRAVRNSA